MNEMNTDMAWKYDIMRAWYIKNATYLEPLSSSPAPIYSIVYESKNPSKKLESKLEPFITYDMKYLGLSPVQDKELFPNNLYILADSVYSKRKWLFLVYPMSKKCSGASTAADCFADHFTFCIDASDKKNPCHFHSTTYSCDIVAGTPMYASLHVRDFMPDVLEFKDGIPNINIFKKHPLAKETLVNFLKYPWSSSLKGGGRALKRTDKARPLTELPLHRNFADKWRVLRIKSLHAFGVREGNVIHWNVSVSRGSMRNGVKNLALHYTTSFDSNHETRLWEEFMKYDP